MWKNIAYIDVESPLMSYQRKLTFNLSHFNFGLSIDYLIAINFIIVMS